MSQSSLVNVKMLTKHHGYPTGKAGRGGAKIDKIFVHHMAGILTVEQCGNVFKSREASAHYGIDGKGRIGQYVLEENTAWHCANRAYNQRSIGIELSNDGGAKTNWHVSDKTIARCIDLIVDICQRNKIAKINYTGDLKGNLCMHCWTASTACPAGYMKTKFKYIADEVNKRLKATPAKEVLYRVRKTWADAKSQAGAYKNLTNAKKIADEKGLNVYDDKGTLVYQGKKKDSVAIKTNAEKINEKAIAYAWVAGTPEKIYKYPSGSPTEAFKEAWKKYFPTKKINCGCHQYVMLVLKACGYPTMDISSWAKILAYLKRNFTEIKVNYTQAQLRAGDIRVHKNAEGGYHIWIIAKDSNGKMVRKEANQVGNKRYAHTNTSNSGNTKKHKADWLFRAK